MACGPERISVTVPASLSPVSRTEVIGASVEGRAIEATIFDGLGETILVLGGVHGDEPSSRLLLERFLKELSDGPNRAGGKKLIVLPSANPDGLLRRTRRNAQGVDLNRNLPSSNWRWERGSGPNPASEPETRALLTLLTKYHPKRILAVHAEARCVNWDGPAEPLARSLASATGYPLRRWMGYPTPGSLGSYAGTDLGIPVVTLELSSSDVTDGLWSEIHGALDAFVRFEHGPVVTTGR